jgi:hypothetical protein
MHDQMQARDMLNRIQGAYKDGNTGANQPPAEAVAAAKSAATTEERQRRYLQLVAS